MFDYAVTVLMLEPPLCLQYTELHALQIYKEETFGPAVPLFKFKHDEEAIKLANDTIYGLASYFFTRVSLTVQHILVTYNRNIQRQLQMCSSLQSCGGHVM